MLKKSLAFSAGAFVIGVIFALFSLPDILFIILLVILWLSFASQAKFKKEGS